MCAGSHLSDTLIDVGVRWQTVKLGGSQLQHTGLAVFAVHLGLDNDHLLLAELGLLLNLDQELDRTSQRMPCRMWQRVVSTFCSSSGRICDMLGGRVFVVWTMPSCPSRLAEVQHVIARRPVDDTRLGTFGR